ncbi:hypothetical protein AXE65_05605 [Ventosimonas gracilis]|uniref:Water stress and hypersensitive response domain-containing protein n=1 Tax=Ventosimonas gracilis TaxID=1680762 RepID=A0A139SNI4_9GAMM|nr:LEA type 2 family protein [Ventosimonas gracilis]KXU36129.1 hypothetical protein AXE65_05605 [Ventosimonas gracilis]
MFGLNQRFFTTVSLFLLLMISGCHTTEDLKTPQIRLVNIEVEEIKLLEQKFILHLQVDNPNDLTLALHRFSYQLWLNNLEIGNGQLDKRFSIAAHNSRLIEVPLHTNIWQHIKPLTAALKNPQNPLHYRLQGKIKTGWLFGSNLHFNSQGEMTPADYLPQL